MKKKRPQTTGQANFRLPVELIRKIRGEAALRGVQPSRVLAERVHESYQREPFSINTTGGID